jgi:pyruvate dehydrogenase E1 component alpha subunit
MGTAVERAAGHQRHLRARRRVRHAASTWTGRTSSPCARRWSARSPIARTESKPVLLEMRTYRFMGHSMSDAVSGTYRTKAELDEYLKRDPINLLRPAWRTPATSPTTTVGDGQEIKAVVQDAWDFADASPEPPLEALYEDVLVDTTS